MLTDNCKKIIDSVLALDESQHFKSHDLQKLCALTGLSFDNVLSACKELDRDCYADLRFIHLPAHQPIPDSIKLTELGKHYKDKRAAERKELFLKSVWLPVLVTLATNGVLSAVKWLWPYLRTLVVRIP